MVRGSALVILLVALGCAADVRTPAARPVPVAHVRHSAGTGAAAPGEPVSLRRRHRAGDRYEVVTSFELGDTPVHPNLGYTTWAEAVIEIDEAGSLVTHGTFRKSELRHGDAVNPLGDESDLAGVEVQLWLDERNRVARDKLAGYSIENESFARVVVDSLSAVRVHYPEGPVRVGQSWTIEPVRWDTRPAGWVVVNVQPTYTLERIDRRGGRARAHIRWSGVAEIEPFEVGGLSLRARVPVDGISIVDLEDGYAAMHDIRGRVELSLTASAGRVSDVATVRIRQQVTRR